MFSICELRCVPCANKVSKREYSFAVALRSRHTQDDSSQVRDVNQCLNNKRHKTKSNKINSYRLRPKYERIVRTARLHVGERWKPMLIVVLVLCNGAIVQHNLTEQIKDLSENHIIFFLTCFNSPWISVDVRLIVRILFFVDC